MKPNAKGQTLEEFLAAYNPAKYRHPAVTADCIIFAGDSVLLVRRGNHPSIGMLAFPGGFSEQGESTEQTAKRELEEETGVSDVPCRQFYTASTPGRDPRDWTVSVCYIAELDAPIAAAGADDAASAEFCRYAVGYENGLTVLDLDSEGGKERTVMRVARDDFGNVDVNRTEILENGMAFDHAKILLRAIEERDTYRSCAKNDRL